MIESVLLFFVGIGALLVSIVSILRLAWLAVLIPMLIAAGGRVRPVRVERPPVTSSKSADEAYGATP